MLWSLWSRDSKIDCISKKKLKKKKNQMEWADIYMLGQIQESF